MHYQKYLQSTNINNANVQFIHNKKKNDSKTLSNIRYEVKFDKI